MLLLKSVCRCREMEGGHVFSTDFEHKQPKPLQMVSVAGVHASLPKCVMLASAGSPSFLIVWHAHPSPSPLQALLGREDGHMYFGESTILISPTVSWLLGAVGCGHIGVRLLAAPNAAHTVEVSGSISHLRLLFKLYEDCEVWNEAHRNCS